MIYYIKNMAYGANSTDFRKLVIDRLYITVYTVHICRGDRRIIMALFNCDKLTKKLGKYKLNDISFMLEPGEILGVIGINGAGKTTLIRSILGSYRIDMTEEDGGSLILDGADQMKNMSEYKSGLAYVLQDTPFSMNMRPWEIGERYGFFYNGFDNKKYKDLLKKYGIDVKKSMSELSKGQQLRVQIAFAECYPAKLYVMDEPTGNLDVDFRDNFYDKIRGFVETEKSSVIISSHLVTELEHLVDKILWIGRNDSEGFVRYFGGIDELKDSYRLLSVDKNAAADIPSGLIAGSKAGDYHSEYLLYSEDGRFEDKMSAEMCGELRFPDIQEIMYYVEKESELK